MKQEQIIECGGQKIKVFNCDPEKNTQCDKGTKLQIDTMRVKHIDMFDIATSADKLISSGIYTVNMILRALGEIPIDEDWADQHFITKNYSTIQEILEEQQKGGGKNAKTG